jgi:hypothetical protein
MADFPDEATAAEPLVEELRHNHVGAIDTKH